MVTRWRLIQRGTLAWLSWLVLHIVELLGNRNRFSTLLNLSWRYLTWRRGGGLIVGDTPTFRVDSMPYGGIRDSGFGREGVRFAIEEMTERKLLVHREG